MYGGMEGGREGERKGYREVQKWDNDIKLGREGQREGREGGELCIWFLYMRHHNNKPCRSNQNTRSFQQVSTKTFTIHAQKQVL